MTLIIQSLTEQQCKEICTWLYPAPYDIYNWPTWDLMVAKEMEFADPIIRAAQFAAIVRLATSKQQNDQLTAELIGYVQYFPLQDVTRLGLGIRPDLCDKGLGQAFMEVIVKEALNRNPDHEIDLEVHPWNERAVKTYLKAGFVQTDAYERMTPTGIGSFYCMVYNGNIKLKISL